ncbi:MAG TPA: hypothetical protein ENH31_02875 [Nitrospirae bacterium]|nr:hypothetical protein [Nitrospirota bacterium]HDK81496.1 hypothetical protein [Nitrospirota bacterium]
MADHGQRPLFYEDFYDALEQSLSASGKTKKEIAAILYPGRTIETAKSLLSRALTPENTDVNLSVEALLTIMKETSADDIIYFLCDEFGFERPARKDKSTFEREVKGQVRDIQERIGAVLQELKRMETGK